MSVPNARLIDVGYESRMADGQLVPCIVGRTFSFWNAETAVDSTRVVLRR
jgi:hypothetical protein